MENLFLSTTLVKLNDNQKSTYCIIRVFIVWNFYLCIVIWLLDESLKSLQFYYIISN